MEVVGANKHVADFGAGFVGSTGRLNVTHQQTDHFREGRPRVGPAIVTCAGARVSPRRGKVSSRVVPSNEASRMRSNSEMLGRTFGHKTRRSVRTR